MRTKVPKVTGEGRRVAIYCRVSSAGQEENSSLGTQETSCRTYADQRGWVVVEVYREVHTGAELFERPELTRLRDAMRAGEFDVLLVHALDRLSRNQGHQGYVLSEAEHAGVAWDSATEDVDDSIMGQILRAIIGGMAAMEREKIAERTKRGTRARVASGKPLVGQKAPFGYKWRDEAKSGFDIDPIAEPVVRRIFESVLASASLRSIATALTADGIPTPTGRGRRWEVSSLHGILKNPIYAGHPFAYRWRQERDHGKYRTILNPESEWVPLPDDAAPAILTEEQFEAIQARLAYNKATAPRNNADPEATLLRCGIVRCGYCGAALSVTRRKGQTHAYRCRPVGRDRHGCPAFQIRAPILDEAVWQRVEEVLTRPEVIEAEVKRRAEIDPYAAELADLDKRLVVIERQRDRLTRAIATVDDEEDVGPLLSEFKILGGRAKELRTDRESIEQSATQSVADRHRLADLASWCDQVADRLPQLTYAEKRKVLESLGTSVTLYRAHHDPRWEIKMEPLPLDPSSSTSVVFGRGTASSTATPESTPRPSMASPRS